MPNLGEASAVAAKKSFDPQVFLAKVGTGKTISKYREDQIVFSQGDTANVLLLQKGKTKVLVLSEQGNGCRNSGAGQFFGEVV